ncbi:hypothetical protein HYDPIDRAFT_100131 [Hydnomerulius pinastri MD-312]|uniref:Uncharacterized protein n=1 Tax=Hydnomerulius pinastri MD-312 TaxID=994086 RepID=A0A0C9W1G7_9AGAM|nr:hypothetical protein HYDPIDRAFT_100131 [Hydnomerulius pinastri MD-312]
MYKPFAALFCAAALASSTLAQSITIALPTEGSTVTAGSNIIVQIDKPMSLTGSEEVAVVIGIEPCNNGVCNPPSDGLGDILYNGPYNPQVIQGAWNPYENFTVTVPSWYSGLAQIDVAHVYLLGAGLAPYLETESTTINIVS